jgi:hypothetical protein
MANPVTYKPAYSKYTVLLARENNTYLKCSYWVYHIVVDQCEPNQVSNLWHRFFVIVLAYDFPKIFQYKI